MTYKKIYIPDRSEDGNKMIASEAYICTHAAAKETTKEKEEPCHCPEIVVSRASYTLPETKPRGVFRLSVGRLVCVAGLCLFSFVMGCTFTNESLAKYIKMVAEFSSGRISSEEKEQNGATQELPTFYEKYMAEQQESGFEESWHMLLDSEAFGAPSEEKVLETVQASAEEPGKIGRDGEVLYTVMQTDMSADDVTVISNQTKFKPDINTLLSGKPKALSGVTVSPDSPLVLIVHTHGTECYNSYETEGFVSEDTPERSADTNENVVAVGKKLATVLASYGIPVIHSEKMCDEASFVNAYNVSYSEVETYLEKYPSIRFVIDLHRDAIELSDGSRKKPVLESFGEKYAQLMFVVGTNEAGANHPFWEENLSLALNVQNEIGKRYPGLFRPLNLRTASFNQQLSDGYMLLECGSAANSLEEAEKAAEAFATGFAEIILASENG